MDDLSEPDRNADDRKMGIRGERSSMTLCKQKRKRNPIELQLLGENTDVAPKNDVPLSKEQNVAQRLNNLKHKSIPNGCIENTGNIKKYFGHCNVDIFLFLLIMIMDDSTTFQEEPIQNSIMEGLENELFLTCLSHVQSTLITKSVAEQVLRNWLEILSTDIDIYFSDVEAFLEAELNEVNHLFS